MQGDFSRNTFSKKNHYRGVLQQQGRVQLDSDLNEQQAINQYYDETGARDLIGPAGVPKSKFNGNGFKIGIASDGSDLTIKQGSIYVDGILCENESDVTYNNQVGIDFKDDSFKALYSDKQGTYIVYLDVWQRHITALDDPNIREKALGGPDTATRIKTVWQVKLAKDDNKNSFENWTPYPASNGKLAAKAELALSSIDPCKLSSTIGYRRLENQLYRVEIHKGGKREEATFKWSRDNGSVTAGVTKIDKDEDDKYIVTLKNINRDEVLGFSRGKWVEVLSDYIELNGQPYGAHGELYRISNVDPSNPKIKISCQLNQQTPDKMGSKNLKLRRWDHKGENSYGIPVNQEWIPLEDGITVNFSGDTFHSGDYWLIPARTAINSETGNIEWPSEGGEPSEVERAGIYHHYCPLALVEFDGINFKTVVKDFRRLFPPLTDVNAIDVGFDNEKCEIPNAENVQDALEYLCNLNDSACSLIASPGKDWELIFNKIADKQDAKICFQVGEYLLDKPVILNNKGHLKISGCGPGTRILAPESEAAFSFESCESVEIHSLYAECGKIGFGKGTDLKHLNGVFTFSACPEINIENVKLKCAAGAEKAATCISIRDAPKDKPDSNSPKPKSKNTNIQLVKSVRVRNNDLYVGAEQVGILLVNVARAVVEDNSIVTSEKPKSLSLSRLLENKKYRSAIRKLVISSPVLGVGKDEKEASKISKDEVLIKTEKGSIRFKTDPSLTTTWQTLANNYLPKGIQNDRDLLSNIEKIIDIALLNKGVTSVSGQKFNGFKDWYELLIPKAAGSQGIVIGGGKAQDIHIVNNKISGTRQGIHVGVSHRSEKGEYDIAGVVHIRDNNISILLPSGDPRHGIFAGNCNSLIIENNYVSVKRLPTTLKTSIEGIKVYGYFGRMMIIRQNHLENTTVGIMFKPLGKVSGTPQWIITDNVAPGAKNTVFLPYVTDSTRKLVRGITENYS